MAKAWITTRRDRKSAIYREMIAQLRRELKENEKPEPDKRERKRRASNEFRAGR